MYSMPTHYLISVICMSNRQKSEYIPIRNVNDLALHRKNNWKEKRLFFVIFCHLNEPLAHFLIQFKKYVCIPQGMKARHFKYFHYKQWFYVKKTLCSLSGEVSRVFWIGKLHFCDYVANFWVLLMRMRTQEKHSSGYK